jgi:hypothetical protein
MVADFYQYVKQCHECTKENSDLFKSYKALRLFPAAGTLDFVAIDLLGPLKRTKAGHQYLLQSLTDSLNWSGLYLFEP